MENENIDVQSLEYALTFKTSEDFQKCVDEHPEIERLEDLRDNYYRIHNRYVNLKQNKKINPITFKKVKFNWENLKTKDDFQKFIDDNHIESSSVIWKKYSGFASRAKRLGIKILDLKFHNVPDKYELVTVEDANKFVKDHNINSLNDLKEKYHEEFLLFRNVRDDIEFPYSTLSWKDFKSVEDIQDFIVKNNIKSRTELFKKFPGLLSKIKSLSILDKLEFIEDKPILKYKIKDRFKTVEDINKYISEKGIRTRSQFKKLEDGNCILGYAWRLGWKIKFPEGTRDLSEYKTKEDFQAYIEEHKIQSPSELKKKDSGIYSRMYKKGFNKDVKYVGTRNRSYVETKVAKKLDELGIEYIEQATFSDLKDKGRLRIDFLIESKKLMLEPGDIQHLTPIKQVVGEVFNTLQKHDEMKRNYCKKNGYTIIYYFENGFKKYVSDEEFKRLVSEYPGECYTEETFDQMFDRILSL